MRIAVIAVLLCAVPIGALSLGAAPPQLASAATRRTKARPAVSPTTALASTSTSTTMTTTTLPPVPPAVITTFDTANGRIHIGVGAVSRSDLHLEVTVQAIGMEEGTTTVALPVGVVDQSVVRTLDPDSRYTFRVGWSDSSELHGPEDTRIVEPVYPQPHYRGPAPVGGPGWSVLFTNEFVPTRRNPCAPIHVHYDPTNAPLDLLPTIRAALVQASADSSPFSLQPILSVRGDRKSVV